MKQLVVRLIWLWALAGACHAQSVFINEIMTSNGGVAVDENGDSSDWIELWNPGPAPVDLSGYGLTDDVALPFRWVFTNAILAPGEFLVVWADGKNRQPQFVAPIAPATLPGLSVWLRAAAVATNDATQVRLSGANYFVRKWADQSGRGNHAHQSNDAFQPRLVVEAGGQAIPPMLRFDGVNDLLTLSAVPAQSSFCVIVVARATVYHEIDPQGFGVGGTSGQRYLFGATHGGDFNAGAGLSVGTNGVSVYEHGSGYMPALAVSGGPLGTELRVLSINYSNRQPFLYVQGSLASAGVRSSRALVTAPTEIGSGAYGAFSGDVTEVLVYNRALSEGEVLAAQQFLANEYGLILPRVWHASFALDQDGETVRLTRPDGTRVDEVLPIEIPRDVSYGRILEGAGSFVFFARPTPGASNTTPGSVERLGQAVFSHAAGFYTNAFELTLAVTNDGATIRYTLDGSEPTETSRLYTGPILVTNRAAVPNNLSLIPTTPGGNQPPMGTVYKFTVVRAKAFRPGALAGDTATRSFIVEPMGTARYTLPLVSIVTNGKNLFDPDIGIYVPGRAPGGNYAQSGDAWERPVHVEFFEPDGSLVIAQPSGLRMHGNTSFGFPIKGLRLHPLNHPGEGPFEYPIFPDLPIGRFNRLLLRASGHDYHLTFFRDAFMQSLGAELGLDTQAYRPALLFFNGEYWGIHNLREAIETGYFASHHGVDPDQVDYLEGYAFPNEGDTQAWDAMIQFMGTHDLSDPAHYATVQTQMEMSNYIAYKVCEIYFYRWDIGNHRPWRPRTAEGRFRWLLFDCDVGWGGVWSVPPAWAFPMLDYDLEPNGPWTQYQQSPGGNDHNNPTVTFLLRALLTNPTFKRDFINGFADAMNTTFHESHVTNRINEFAARLAPEMGEHIRRWRAPSDLTTWSNNVQYLREFAAQRPSYMRQHLINRFHLSGTVNVTLQVNDTNAGAIRINTLTTSGPTNAPWQGVYFKGNPITLAAEAKPGYRFSRWTGLLDPSNRVTLLLAANTTLMANFVPLPETNAPAPAPFVLATGPYLFARWDATAPAGSYPPNMLFTVGTNRDPGLGVEFTNVWALRYDRTNRSRFLGLGGEGVGFLNTSDPPENGGGYLGAAILALNTTGVGHAQVKFTAGTVTPNSRAYGLRLQSRVGAAGSFADVLDARGQPVEYLRHPVAGHSAVHGPIDLPTPVLNQPYIQLRWKYYHLAGTDGPRSQLRLDDVVVAEDIRVAPPIFSGVAFRPEGTLRLRFTGSPLQTYLLETSTNLVHWLPLETLVTGTEGTYEFLNVSDQPVRFYRLRAP